ncbi:MAG: hypothetical protein IJD60_10710, partial [Clostridia bacterium]|nr:hypothetical protein [Clostridia bacterium]
MKKHILILLILVCLLPACALAAPQLYSVLPGDASLVSGADGWYFDFFANEGGTLSMELLSGETGETLYSVGGMAVEAGNGRMHWNGLFPDGAAVPAGDYMAQVRMKNFWGEESGSSVFSLHIFESEAQRSENTLDLSLLAAEEAAVWEEGEIVPQDIEVQQEGGIPSATGFWDMNPDDYDLSNPDHQQAIWDLMMQPITVLEGDQTENIYITNEPGISARPYKENCAGELHGQSQGVNVLAIEGDYALIEAYTNDGTKTDNSYMESIAASKVQGYVKKSRL